MTAPAWRRSALVWPDNALTFADDWTLVSADGERLARIYDAGQEDGVEPGTWRWRVAGLILGTVLILSVMLNAAP